MALRTPYLTFLGDAPDQLAAKTAAGIAHRRPEISRGRYYLPASNADRTRVDPVGIGVAAIVDRLHG